MNYIEKCTSVQSSKTNVYATPHEKESRKESTTKYQQQNTIPVGEKQIRVCFLWRYFSFILTLFVKRRRQRRRRRFIVFRYWNKSPISKSVYVFISESCKQNGFLFLFSVLDWNIFVFVQNVLNACACAWSCYFQNKQHISTEQINYHVLVCQLNSWSSIEFP